jgi:hypothetical protein
MFGVLSCASGAQTFTLNDQIANFDQLFTGIEYSGVGSITNSVMTNNASPGLGAGAIVGASVTVPTGSLLISSPSEGSMNETITVATAGSTNRGSSAANPVYYWAEWQGTGAAIQPTFTTSANGTLEYTVWQFILNPLNFSSGPLPRQIYVMP